MSAAEGRVERWRDWRERLGWVIGSQQPLEELTRERLERARDALTVRAGKHRRLGRFGDASRAEAYASVLGAELVRRSARLARLERLEAAS